MKNGHQHEQPHLPFDAPESSLADLSPLQAKIVNIVFRKDGNDISESLKEPTVAEVDLSLLQSGETGNLEVDAVEFAQQHGLAGVHIFEDEDATPSSGNRNLRAEFHKVPILDDNKQKPGRGPTIGAAKRNARLYRQAHPNIQ